MAPQKTSMQVESITIKSESKKYLPDFPEGIPVLFETNRGLGQFLPYVYIESEALYKQDSANIFLEKTFRATIKPTLESVSLENIDFLESPPLTDNKPVEGATFAEIPDKLLKKEFYKSIQEQFKQLIKSKEEIYYFSPYFKLYSNLGESQDDFLNRIKDRISSIFDSDLSKVKDKFTKDKFSLEGKLKTAEDKKARAETELKALTTETAMDIGSGIFSILTGRSGRSSLRRAGSNAITRREKVNLRKQQAEMEIEQINNELSNLQSKLDALLKEKEAEILSKAAQVEEKLLRPNPSSIAIKYIGILFR
jgi:hypothetical protein